MSYTRSFTRSISVPYSGTMTVSFPASQTGGSRTVSYSGYAQDTVQVDVHVDTNPFDASVDHCSNNVDGLTASVVATEAAEVASIRKRAEQVGNTVVEGFFSTVKFEISTQIVELTKRVEALLLDINEKQKRLLALQNQMNVDYQRTKSRYAGIFTELDKELSNRVHAIDQPVFEVAGLISETESRFMDGELINDVSVAGKENALLDAQIGVALAKKHAHSALNEAGTFLAKKNATEQTIKRCTIDECKEQVFYAPVCCLQSTDVDTSETTQVFLSEILPDDIVREVADRIPMQQIGKPTEEELKNVKLHFNNLLNQQYSTDDAHSARIRKVISNLYSSNY